MDKNNTHTDMKTALYQETESKTNRDNIKCLLALAIVLAVCEVLNEIGLFQVFPVVMRTGAACGIFFYLAPVVALGRPLSLFKKDGELLYHKQYKYFIIVFAWLGTIAMCITLTHHTVPVMAVPILIMAQYRNTKQLVPIAIVLGTICVFLSVYGGYFWGCFDGNLLHIGITDENAFDLALRLNMADMHRMTELLTHYVLPREIVMLSLLLLASKISQRNDGMLAQQAQLQDAIEQEMQRTNEIQWQIIDGMANLIENRDTSTGEHVKRTSYYVKSIVDKLQIDPKYKDELGEEISKTIVKAAPLHDIGKIVVSDRILQKPGRLTPKEYNEIKLHAAEGARVIENVLGNVEDEAFLNAAKDISGCHHERWDGKGYPHGLKGRQIPLSARIMAVADVFDALVSERVYKASIPPEEAFRIIESESGKQFDPAVVKAFCSLKPEIIDSLNNGFEEIEERKAQ